MCASINLSQKNQGCPPPPKKTTWIWKIWGEQRNSEAYFEMRSSMTQKDTRRYLDIYYKVTSFWLFIYVCKCNFTSKCNKQKYFEKRSFLLASCQLLTKKAESGYGSVSQWVRIRGSGSVPKCHRSTTLKYTGVGTVPLYSDLQDYSVWYN